MAARDERPDYPEIGEQLRAAAQNLGLSLGDIAHRAGVAKTAVKNALDGGNLTLSTLCALAEVLQIRRLEVGRLELQLATPDLDATLVRAAAKKAREAGELFERLAADAEQRAETARLIGEMGADAAARKRAATTSSEAAKRKKA